MLNLMPVPHVLHVKEITPTSRRTNNCGGHNFTCGPDVRHSHASTATSAMAENHIKTNSIGLQPQAEFWNEHEELPGA